MGKNAAKKCPDECCRGSALGEETMRRWFDKICAGPISTEDHERWTSKKQRVVGSVQNLELFNCNKFKALRLCMPIDETQRHNLFPKFNQQSSEWATLVEPSELTNSIFGYAYRIMHNYEI